MLAVALLTCVMDELEVLRGRTYEHCLPFIPNRHQLSAQANKANLPEVEVRPIQDDCGILSSPDEVFVPQRRWSDRKRRCASVLGQLARESRFRA